MSDSAVALDLRGVKAKIGRANEHSTELQITLGRIFDTEHDFFRTEVDSSGLHHTFHTTQVPAVAIRWSTIIGDVLVNLRAALDHLAHQLVRLDGRKPTRKTQFPILKSAYDDKGNVRHADICPGIRDSAIRDLLDEVQPYKRGEGVPAMNHQLWALNRLVNTDKHRLLLVVQLLLDKGNIFWGSTVDAEQPKIWLATEPVTDHMHVATFDFPRTPPGPEFKPHLSLTVRFDEGPAGSRLRNVPLRQLLQEIEDFVSHGVMVRFTPLFPPDTPGHPGADRHW